MDRKSGPPAELPTGEMEWLTQNWKELQSGRVQRQQDNGERDRDLLIICIDDRSDGSNRGKSTGSGTRREQFGFSRTGIEQFAKEQAEEERGGNRDDCEEHIILHGLQHKIKTHVESKQYNAELHREFGGPASQLWFWICKEQRKTHANGND